MKKRPTLKLTPPPDPIRCQGTTSNGRYLRTQCTANARHIINGQHFCGVHRRKALADFERKEILAKRAAADKAERRQRQEGHAKALLAKIGIKASAWRVAKIADTYTIYENV